MGVSLDGLSDDALTASQDSAQRLPPPRVLAQLGLTTLPPAFRGSGSSVTTMYCGTLKSARRLPANSSTSATSTVIPGRLTSTAPTFPPII